MQRIMATCMHKLARSVVGSAAEAVRPAGRPAMVLCRQQSTQTPPPPPPPSTQQPQTSQQQQQPAKIIKGQIAKRYPAYVSLEPGKKYHWCSCGLSAKQPFCDGKHKTMPEPKLSPVQFEVTEAKKYLLCRCKQTNNRPFCDLTHVKTFIPGGLREKLGIKL